MSIPNTAGTHPQIPLPDHRTVGTRKPTFDALTGLRFLAALGVVFYHFAGTLAETWPLALSNLTGSGFVAVSFFYVLSGFVLSYSYVSREGVMQGSRRSFWVNRFARIYPAYLLAFLIAAPFNILGTLRVNHLATAITKIVSGAGVVLTMQQAWTPWTAWYWNYPAWSVSAEAFFYLVFPFIALGLKRMQGKACWQGMIFLWLLAMLPPVLLCFTPHAYAPVGDRLAMTIEFTPLLRLPEFLLGVLLGRAYVLGFRLSQRASERLSYASLSAILICLSFSSMIPRPLLANGLLAPLFALLIYSLAEGYGLLARLLALPLLVLLGEASYGIYILQIPVSYLLRRPPPHTSGITLCVYLVVLIVVSLLSWRFVEMPARTFIRDKLIKRAKSTTHSRNDFRPAAAR